MLLLRIIWLFKILLKFGIRLSWIHVVSKSYFKKMLMVLQKGFHSIWSCYTSQPLEYRREYVIRSAKTVIYQNFLNIFCRTAFLWWVSKGSILSSWHFGLGICFNTRLIIRWFDQKWRLITLKPTRTKFEINVHYGFEKLYEVSFAISRVVFFSSLNLQILQIWVYS